MGAGPGRPPGTPNKTTKALKDMILGALDSVGGESYLAEQAEANPTAFLTLIGKVLPMAVNLGDANGEKFSVSIHFPAKSNKPSIE